MPRSGDTGFPMVDAQSDFLKARRKRLLSRIAARLRGEPSDFDLILPFEEVVAALGRRGERFLGLQSIELDSIVGTVERSREFDRGFRPTSSRVRGRWERIAEAERRGEAMPPIDVYRIGQLHFVRDGHHRVSVARAQGRSHIDANVTEILTNVGAGAEIRLKDLPLKSHERVFYERVPLSEEARARVRPSNPEHYANLAESVEAWGFRAIQARGELMSRAEVAEAWYREEYVPVVELLAEAELIDSDNETDAYMRVAEERYMLLRTHEWDESVIERLKQQRR